MGGAGLRVPARNALLADVVPAQAYGRAYGFERTMDNLGAIVRPDAAGVIDELVTHPHLVLTRMSPADAASVEELLAASRTFDVLAAWAVHLCRQRGGWSASIHRSLPSG